MKVNYESDKGIMKFHFLLESDDTTSYQIQQNSYKTNVKVSLGRRTCKFHLPQDWTLNSVHPDLLALATIAIIYPFIGSKIILPERVSHNFHNTFKKLTGKEVLPINPRLQPRKAEDNSCPALAYSGGVDSTAASILLPESSHLLYVDRITPKEFQIQKTLLNQEAAYYACDSMKKLGRSVHSIKSDVHFVRSPVGFHTFLSDSVSSLLIADYYGFDSLANGHTLEEGYRVGYKGYQDAKKSSMIKIWDSLLKAVDMPYCLPTIGLSEVCTSQIVINSPYYEFTQACSRGKVYQPCMNCYKCFRKTLLEKVLKKEPIDDSLLNWLFKIKDAQSVLTKSPIHFENVITYITSKYKGNHPIMNLIKKKTRGDTLDTSWMEKWNPSSLQFIAPKYQEYVKSGISKYIETMNDIEQENMKTFNYKHIPNSSDLISYDKELKALLSHL